jgi:hypothetical protein
MISPTDKDQKVLGGAGLSSDEKEKFGLYYDEHKKFGVPDVMSSKVVTVETNWNEFVGRNQFLKLRFGDEEVIVRNEDLRSILKILAPLVESDEMLTHSKRFYTTRKRLYGIRLTRDYRRGEEIRVEIDVPERVY